MRGGNNAQPTGAVEQLLREVRDADGGLGPEAIAEIVDCEELPVDGATTTDIKIG